MQMWGLSFWDVICGNCADDDVDERELLDLNQMGEGKGEGDDFNEY